MKLLSIDVGIAHLAWCKYDSETQTIASWQVSSVSPVRGDMARGVVALIEKSESLRPTDVDCIVIERQPGRNLRIKAIENYLHMYYVLRATHQPVELYHPRQKLAGTGKHQHRGRSAAMYRERKKASIALCRAWLSANLDRNAEWLEMLNRSPKRDDLADALAQALAYCDQRPDATAIGVAATEEIVRARRPTSRQIKTGSLTRSNLKHLLTKEWTDVVDRKTAVDHLRQHTAAFRAVRTLYGGNMDACVAHLCCFARPPSAAPSSSGQDRDRDRDPHSDLA